MSRLLLLVVLLILPAAVSARMPFLIYTADREFVYVDVNSYPRDPLVAGFPETGMYRNDGSLKPLWKLPCNCIPLIVSDGRHAVVNGYDDGGREIWGKMPAIQFYEDGRLVRAWEMSEVATFPFMLPVPSHGGATAFKREMAPSDRSDIPLLYADFANGFDVNNGAAFDENLGTMTVKTHFGDVFTFDYRTGEMIAAERPTRTLAILLTGIAVILWLTAFGLGLRARLGRRVRFIWALGLGCFASLSMCLVPILAVWAEYDVKEVEFLWFLRFTSVIIPRYLLIWNGNLEPNNWISFDAMPWIGVFWLPLTLLVARLVWLASRFAERFQPR